MSDKDDKALLPAIIEFQKLCAEALRSLPNAADNPEGYALVVVEALHHNGLQVARINDGR